MAIAALFLRGGPGRVETAPARASAVVGCLRGLGDRPPGEWPDALARAGFWAEAAVLRDARRRDWAERIVREGRCLTCLSEAYPPRWRRLRSPPAALWLAGEAASAAWIGLVGSRRISSEVAAFAEACGAEAGRLGYGLVSGGALGCDSAGARGAALAGAPVLEVLPYGLARLDRPPFGAAVSLRAPDEPFSAEAAMERNGLIYAAAAQTVVCHARFKEGGAWWGAVGALRARTSELVVREDRAEPGLKALLALGGKPLAVPANLQAALAAPGLQPGLF